jgi:hypothetical protein
MKEKGEQTGDIEWNDTFPPIRNSSARSWNWPWISPHIVTGLLTGWKQVKVEKMNKEARLNEIWLLKCTAICACRLGSWNISFSIWSNLYFLGQFQLTGNWYFQVWSNNKQLDLQHCCMKFLFLLLEYCSFHWKKNLKRKILIDYHKDAINPYNLWTILCSLF